jgi:hypothetical protein
VSAPPLCRYCGGKIRKRVTSVEFVLSGQAKGKSLTPWAANGFTHRRFVVVDQYPRDRAACKPFTNGQVVSVKKNYRDAGNTIAEFGEWDGESYVDRFFCNGDHARKFAYAVAHAYDVEMPAHRKAVEAQGKTT